MRGGDGSDAAAALRRSGGEVTGSGGCSLSELGQLFGRGVRNLGIGVKQLLSFGRRRAGRCVACAIASVVPKEARGSRALVLSVRMTYWIMF